MMVMEYLPNGNLLEHLLDLNEWCVCIVCVCMCVCLCACKFTSCVYMHVSVPITITVGLCMNGLILKQLQFSQRPWPPKEAAPVLS